jgi:hypothetical protein
LIVAVYYGTGVRLECSGCGAMDSLQEAMRKMGGTVAGSLDKYLRRHGRCGVAQHVPDVVASQGGTDRTDNSAGS